MPDAVATILSAEDDTDLCSSLFAALLAHHGDRFDPGALPAEHRAVLLIWHTQEVIGNRGFNGFLGADMPGDPDYRYMRDAYEAVGCEPAAAAVRRLFDAFPAGKAPADARARVQAFGKANHAVHGALNRDFLKAQGALTTALARYIREHASTFAGIDQPGPPRPTTAPPALEPEEDDSVETGADQLPQWAQVAFHARCARQVFPLWDEAWPDAPADYRDAVEQTIVLAELCAAEGKPVGDLKAAAAHPARIAAAALAAQDGRPTAEAPPAQPQRAALIAAAAGSAIDHITGQDDTGSYVIARLVTEEADRDDLLEDIHDDFQRIRQLARDHGWTDKTPIPPEVFDPTYKPSGKWWKVW
jgi:Domain of unknown function (DUF4375)